MKDKVCSAPSLAHYTTQHSVSQTFWDACNGAKRAVNRLRQGDNLVAGTMITGLTGLAAAGLWAARAYSGNDMSDAYPMAATVLSLSLAKFYEGAEGVVAVYTKYFPKALELTRSAMKPNPTCNTWGMWSSGISSKWSQFFDPDLAVGMIQLLKKQEIETAYDFGCGHNKYSYELQKNDIECLGIDGNPQLAIDPSQVLERRLSHSGIELAQRQCVISLEVGAKIPKEFEDQFLLNIVSTATDMIIISWPIPGQKGPLQKNPQTNQYIIEKFNRLGWKYDKAMSNELRASANPICYWFKNTIMVFLPKG